MSPRAQRALAAYRRQTPASRVTLRQGTDQCEARARVMNVRTDELIGGLDQTVRTVIVLAEEVTLPLRLDRGDQVVLPTGDLLTIEIADGDTRSVDGVLLAYELTVKG